VLADADGAIEGAALDDELVVEVPPQAAMAAAASTSMATIRTIQNLVTRRSCLMLSPWLARGSDARPVDPRLRPIMRASHL
jgi:hypothetical protein